MEEVMTFQAQETVLEKLKELGINERRQDIKWQGDTVSAESPIRTG